MSEVSATIATEKRDAAESQNVVADMRKSANDPPSRQVILGAHYDTVEDTQGASDNGSGLAALLTVARHIAGRDYPFDVRIVLFGTEEFGLVGSRALCRKHEPRRDSRHHCDAELRRAGVGDHAPRDWRLRPHFESH